MNKKVALIVPVLVFLLLVALVPMFFVANPGNPAGPEGTLDLFDAADMDNNVTWVKGSEPGTYPNFDVKVMITNVSQYYVTIFCLAWDPSILNLTSIIAGDAVYNATKTMFGPAIAELNRTTGELREWAYGQLGADAGSVKTYTDPAWGWVATLKFKFVGTPPSIHSPVYTLINITYIEDGHKTSWYHLVNGRTMFQTLGKCGFHYEAVPLPPHSPTANFTIVTPPPYSVCTTITFNASASTGGYDGDNNTAITEFRWTWNDGTTSVTASPVITHHYNTSGNYAVTLVVVAPGIGPYIHPDYEDTSWPFSRPIEIQEVTPTSFEEALAVISDPNANPCRRAQMITYAINTWLGDWKGILPTNSSESVSEVTEAIYSQFLERGEKLKQTLKPVITGTPAETNKPQETELIKIAQIAIIFVINIIDITINVPIGISIWDPDVPWTPEEAMVTGLITHSTAFVIMKETKGVAYFVETRWVPLTWLLSWPWLPVYPWPSVWPWPPLYPWEPLVSIDVVVLVPVELVKTITYEYVYNATSATWSIQKTVDKEIIREDELFDFAWYLPKADPLS